jgi:hypothetical protein
LTNFEIIAIDRDFIWFFDFLEIPFMSGFYFTNQELLYFRALPLGHTALEVRVGSEDLKEKDMWLGWKYF